LRNSNLPLMVYNQICQRYQCITG